MEKNERESAYYHPGGIPITPQARKFGYEFPVWVSDNVWAGYCVASGINPKRNTSTDKRIIELLQYCYQGMAKKLAAEDDFLYYEFKVWFWSRIKPNANKKRRARLGARLFLDPSTDGPWLYIFSPGVDYIDTLKKGEAPDETSTIDEALSQVGDYVAIRPELEATGDAPDGGSNRGDDPILQDSEGSQKRT